MKKIFLAAALSLALPVSTFVPVTTSIAATGVISGVASWYGPGFHGRKTASGERYNMDALTAAHKSLPFGTRVRVTNRNNGKSVVVKINDRGPYVGGRVIDLSRGAARTIGMIGSGTAKVTVEILGKAKGLKVASSEPVKAKKPAKAAPAKSLASENQPAKEEPAAGEKASTAQGAAAETLTVAQQVLASPASLTSD